ncbi:MULTISPECIES: ATP-binding cassette domain-containing protein [unclassified Pseudodesulfovibrio]|uniref:ATP-binding cassette domain-containing protein n=1 Tax=unclassified Pseudodesulfovibrio TaxID=2661612 RepID=UPI000FEBE42C|nr:MULTISPECIES: ATP-binding cassette domain-containing protein [unclassified Pseudodesulfovibrio]MCJ2163405.1 ATP-binding cassette domain-containing protein [Pseudodesulfovibrio sp. S3-i]RWU06641.1 ABC transporter ATP-binding protein [Pseudodesulfovibrio sp. S3]
MIHLNKVCKRHGNTDLVLNCSLTVESGQAVCLCGPSGIGKTTLLEIMAGLTPPDSGTVRLDSKRIGCAFQDDILVPWLNALDNLLLVLPTDTRSPESAALTWLERFDLNPHIRPTKMSGGMRRRLSLARAFAVNPRILLLDEPFAFLDPAWQSTVADCTERHRAAGNTVLLVSHQMEHMEAIDCRTITISHGPISDLREAHAPLPA